MSAADWAHVHPDLANFERLESPTRRAFLRSMPPLLVAALGFGIAGLVAASSCDTKPPPAHSNGGSKTRRSSMTGPQRGNGENPQRGG